MIIRKCDFCGAEGAEEVNLPQPNTAILKNKGVEIARFRESGFYYKNFDLCSDC